MLVNGVNFTVGADPEIFIKKNGIIQSAFGLIKGNKKDPHVVRNGAVQVDGMALEFNIDPAEDAKQFQQNLEDVQAQLAHMIGDFEFAEEVSNLFDIDYLQNQPLEAVLLGCDPDYNGWTMVENEAPDSETNLRTVGGHVHIGSEEMKTEDPYITSHFKTAGRLARILDEQLGVYSILWDKDDKRRELYGKAGAFRPKTYGMEYRSLSSKWIFNKGLVQFVYDGVKDAIEKMFDVDYEPDPNTQVIIDYSLRDHPFFKNNDKADRVMEIVRG